MLRPEERILRRIESTSIDAVNIKEITFGRVVTLSPLTINEGGLILTQRNLIVNEDLLSHKKTISYKEGNDTITRTMTVKSCLSIGDEIALREIDDKTKLVLCKVVRY